MKLPVFLMLFLFSCLVSAQNRIAFEHLSIDDGLANNSVRCISQDREGYLWFGTLNGLCRYDGQQFKTFYSVPEDSTTISSNKIWNISQDSIGYIWVNTYDQHAHRFDPKTESFVNFPEAFGSEFSDYLIDFIYESSPGVMWLCFDGNGCVRIISSPDSSECQISWFSSANGLPSDNIRLMQKSENGGVWFATTNGLLYLPDDRMAESEMSKDKIYLDGTKCTITALCEHGETVWVGCQGGEVFKLSAGKSELFWKSEGSTSEKNVTFITLTDSGNICIGTHSGLLLANPNKREKQFFTNRNSGLNSNYIVSFYHDRNDNFWLVTDQRGVTRFQTDKNEFTYFSLHPEVRESILEGEKQIFLEDRNNDLWVGIYGGGLARFDQKTEQFIQYLHEENNPGSLSSNLILSLFEDRSGNLWAGTFKRVLNKINLQQNNFHTLNDQAFGQSDFDSEVRALFEDSRQWIWTGNKRGEVIVYNQQMQQLFSLNDLLKQKKITAGVYSIGEDQGHNIWLGTKGGGIYVLENLPSNPDEIPNGNMQITNLSTDSACPNSLSHNDVFDLHCDRFGQMWVGLYHGGVDVIPSPLQDTLRILHYRHNENDKYSLSDNRVRCFLEDRRGNMWIGSDNGLNFLSEEYLQADNKRFRKIEKSAVEGSISHNDIISLFQDSDSAIWVGTYGGGMNKVRNTKTGEFYFERFGQEDGLSSNLVFSLVEDGHKNLWIGTDFGLCKFNLNKRANENYYANDGLGENSFSEGPCIRTSSDMLLFGHISGMVWFDPMKITKSERQVPVVLTDLIINGKTEKQKLNDARTFLSDSAQSLHLKYNENFVTFEFAALDFKEPSKIQYTFKLENYEQNWNNSGNLNKAIYRGLQPGNYLFRMKASNSDGLWVNQEMTLALSIAPPPWKTGWAYLIYLLIAIGLFIVARRIVLERIRLKHEVEFEKQLADDKLKFYTSISHEFKTPLALILGPVEDLLANKNLSAEMASPLKMVKRNTHRLLELIEQLMDFRKIQKGFLKVNRRTDDVVRLLNEIYKTFVPLAERKEIDFRFSHELSLVEATLDYKSLEKIVFNLLSNAFKHTGPGESIELILAVDSNNQKLKISVKDEGEGIREQDLPYLFERFSFGNRSRWKDESSTGIGLSLTKELVELQGGTISVKSDVGKGSCFSVVLPVTIDEKGVFDETELDYTRQFISVVEEETAENKESAGNGWMMSKETILVVEDNPDLRAWLSSQLGLKFRVLQAENGKEGLEQAKNENPDLIICDIMMPEMDGIELTGILKNEFHTSHIPIILLTAKSLEEHKIEGIETGADDYITKPFNMAYLQKRVENILRQRKQLKERFSRDLQSEPNDLARTEADQEFLAKVIRLVEENLSDPEFSIDNLIDHFSFGRTVFYKKMKGISGYSPKDFMRILRMKKAGALLRDSNLSVTEVGFEIGFNDSNYFSKLFKKHFGETPSDYQKRHR